MTQATLAAQQAALLAALTGAAPVPEGFDAARVRAAAETLAFKRVRAVAHAWPTLRSALGDRLRERFAQYAAAHPLPAQGGPLADGLAFVRHLSSSQALPDAVELQRVDVETRFRRSADGIVARRWPCVRIAWLHEARRVVVLFRFNR